MGIVTLDSIIPQDYISHFGVDLIEEVYLMLNIKESKKKKKIESYLLILLKLLVYTKIEYVESAKYIASIAKYHKIYSFVSDDIKL